MGIVFSCCAGQALSCCTSVCCSCFGKLNLTGSIATRITYATIFLLNSGLAAIFSHPYIFEKLESITYGYLKLNCGTEGCYGPIAVHRVCFALTLLHFILAGLVFNVNDTHNPRAKIQNQYWSGKVLAWVGFLVISFFIPHVFFIYWSKYVALLGAGIFMLIQLLLLIDFTHSWAERCLENWENDNSDKWKWILVGSTLSVFCISIVMIGLEYGFFSGHGCTLNQTVISLNLVFAFIAVFLSIHPRVQDVNPKSGLTQAGIMVLYGTYLIASAMINEPTGDGEGEIAKHCNPMDKTASGKSINFAIGAIFTIIAIVYSTSRAATQSSTILASSPEYSSLPLSDPSSRSNAIQAAVSSGSISQSEANEDDGGRIVDDEETGVAYNYTFFHLVFAIASMYAAMLLTNWGDFHVDDSAVYIGRSMYALWVKVGTSWIAYGLFFWTLVAPILLPDREWL